MRLRDFVSCRRFLLPAPRDKVSRGAEQLPRVPLPASTLRTAPIKFWTLCPEVQANKGQHFAVLAASAHHRK